MNILSMNGKNGNPESPFSSSSGSVVLYLEPVLNSYFKSYQNILTLSVMPSGPLKNMVSRIKFPKLSEFSSSSPFSPFSPFSIECGTYVLGRYTSSINMSNSDSFMYADDIPSVLSYLQTNGYTIDTSLTTMLQKSEIRIGANTGASGNRRMVCMFTYNE
jgi:hypothetical protein